MPFSLSFSTKTTTSKHNLVLVRHRNTGEVEVCRAHTLSGPIASHEHIHFVGRDRRLVCRCRRSHLHHRKVSFPSEESERLSESLERYMNRNDLETCLMDDYWEDKDRRRAGKGENGSRRGSQDEKKGVQQKGSSSGADSRPGSSKSDVDSPPPSYHSLDWRSRANSVSTTVSSKTPRETYSTEASSRHASDPTSTTVSMGLRSRRPADPDIPPQVWQNARPSMWTPRLETESEVSTPMGSTFSPVLPPATMGNTRSVPRDQDALRTTNSRSRDRSASLTSQSDISRWSFRTVRTDPTVRGPNITIPAQSPSPPAYTEIAPRASRSGDNSIPDSLLGLYELNSHGTTVTRYPQPEGLGLAELLGQRGRVEMNTEPRRNLSRQTETVRELEGRSLLD
ncbi:hypothetical protein IQ07DRAFT_381755 [Pyrenochaeta sp. DS3sAY3a]|nr:hypothetical protein IQ07DRAFT_381755 [Pyrenochaeta sp. DS3sAY3a]